MSWDRVIGQDRAVAQLQAAVANPVHAYLLVGPPGSGRRAAARAFAAEVLAAGSTGDEAERHRRLAEAEQHPDLVLFETERTTLSVDDAGEIIRTIFRAPVEGRTKVLVLTDFQNVDRTAPKLLKAIEEPPESAVILILTEDVPPELVTIASRAVRVDFGPVPEDRIVDALVAEGAETATALAAAKAAGGNMDRARLLVNDAGLAARHEAWHSLPDRLDGTGAAVMTAVAELRDHIDTVERERLAPRQVQEVADAEARAEQYGVRRSGVKQLETKHRSEKRRLRTDELRFGLATVAARYREELTDSPRPADVAERLAAIQSAGEALIRNPNESLLLENLLLTLSH
jgi:DNA polymerase-3 subunit delta'